MISVCKNIGAHYSQRCLLVGRQRCSKTLSRNFFLFSTNRTPKWKNSIWRQWKAASTSPPNYIKFTESRTQRNGRTKGKKGQISIKGHSYYDKNIFVSKECLNLYCQSGWCWYLISSLPCRKKRNVWKIMLL